MRDLILKMAISVDGFVGDLDGRNTWMFGADQEAKAWGVEFIWNASLHIMGSRLPHQAEQTKRSLNLRSVRVADTRPDALTGNAMSGTARKAVHAILDAKVGFLSPNIPKADLPLPAHFGRYSALASDGSQNSKGGLGATQRSHRASALSALARSFLIRRIDCRVSPVCADIAEAPVPAFNKVTTSLNCIRV